MTCGDAGGMTKAGTPCRSTMGLSEMSGLCLVHDPERVAERTLMRSAFPRRRIRLVLTRTPEELDAYRKDFMNWLQTQRQKLRDRNMAVSKNLKALLDPKEADRLSEFDRNKEMPVPAPKKK